MLKSKLDGFNYKNMKKMSIREGKDTKDEISNEVSVWITGKDDSSIWSGDLDSSIMQSSKECAVHLLLF